MKKALIATIFSVLLASGFLTMSSAVARADDCPKVIDSESTTGGFFQKPTTGGPAAAPYGWKPPPWWGSLSAPHDNNDPACASEPVRIAGAAAMALFLSLVFALRAILGRLPEFYGDARAAFATVDPSAENPHHFHDWWNQLTPEEKDSRYQQNHNIGNSPGMPWVDKDEYNRLHLDELIESAQDNVDQLQQRIDVVQQSTSGPIYMQASDLDSLQTQLKTAVYQLDGYTAVRDALQVPDGVPPLYLAMIDDQGHAAVSIGDPNTATRNALWIPGTGEDLATFGENNDRALNMYDAARRADPKQVVSVTTWMGYDRPMDLLDASSPVPAIQGAQALDLFVNGMHASQMVSAIYTVVPHSYANVVVGTAGKDGQLAVDNVVAVGAPGMWVSNAGDLRLNPGANVYAMTAANDPIQLWGGESLGTSPDTQGFGATVLYANPGPGSGPSGVLPSDLAHSSYFNKGTIGLANIGAIIAGRPPVQIVTPPGAGPVQ